MSLPVSIPEGIPDTTNNTYIVSIIEIIVEMKKMVIHQFQIPGQNWGAEMTSSKTKDKIIIEDADKKATERN